jgi:hypothetical protein
MAGLLGLGGLSKFGIGDDNDEDRTTKTSGTSTSTTNYKYPEEYGNILSTLSGYLTPRLGQGLKPYKDNIGLQNMVKTIEGGYDPNTSEYYQAYRGKAKQEMEDALQYLDETSAGANQFFSGGRDWSRAKEGSKFASDLAVTSAGLAEKERTNQLNAAYQYFQSELGLDQATTNALMSLIANIKPEGQTTTGKTTGEVVEPPASLLDYLSAIGNMIPG